MNPKNGCIQSLSSRTIYLAMWRFLQRVAPLIILFLTFGAQHAVAQIAVNAPDVQGTINESGVIAIDVGNLTGQSVTAFQFVLSYDPSIIEITGTTGTGTLSDGKLLLENTTVSGQISVSGASDFDYEGEGTLLFLDVTYLSTGVSNLTFDSFMFNEGTPTANTSNGSVSVTNSEEPGPVNISLPNSSVGTVNESQVLAVTVDNTTGKNIQSYEFTFTYNPALLRVDGVVTENTLSSGSTPSTDVSTPGEYVVTWLGGQALEGQGPLVNLSVTPIGAGTVDLGLADVTFNAGSPLAVTSGGQMVITEDQGDVLVASLPQVAGEAGQQLLIPITIGDLTGEGVSSFEMTVDFDPSIVRFDGVSQQNTLSDGTAPIVNLASPGKAIVSWASVSTLEGAGVLLNFEVTLLSTGTSPLTFESFRLNEGMPEVQSVSGSITVVDSGTGVNVSLPDNINGQRDTQILIPLSTTDIASSSVTSFVTTITFDNSVVNVSGVDLSGTLTDGSNVSVDTNTPGQVVISYSGTQALGSGTTLLNLVVDLLAPGTSALSITSFRYNNGSPTVMVENGQITVGGQAAFIQVVHNSSDSPAFDIYINDVQRVDGLTYLDATAFIDLVNFEVKIEVVDDNAPNNSSPIASLNVVLENGKDYVAVVNGLSEGSGKQAIGLVVQESQQEATTDESVGLVMFQGSPDAPPINAYIVDDSGQYNRVLTLAKGLSFGDSFLTSEFEPGIYNIEVTQNNGPRIGIYRADLTRTGGASFLFMVQGFINPLIGQPDLAMTVYAPDGQGIVLDPMVSVNNEEEDELPDGFQLHGNYPNPFNPSTSIRFDLPEPASVRIEVYDIAGRNVLNIPDRQYFAGDNHAIQLDASFLSSGTYLYRLIAHGAQQTYVQSKKMLLIK